MSRRHPYAAAIQLVIQQYCPITRKRSRPLYGLIISLNIVFEFLVCRIAVEAEKVFNQAVYFKRMIKSTGEPMEHLESIASSAVRAATKVMAAVIVVFTSSGRAARLIAKYRPTMPVLCIVIPRLHTNHLRWSFTGAFQARQSLVVRGLFPMLADPRHSVETSNESILKVLFFLFCLFCVGLAGWYRV